MIQQEESVEIDLSLAIVALTKASQDLGDRQMKRIYQIEKFSAQNRQFAKDYHQILKLQAAKSRLEKTITAKKEKIKSRILLNQVYESCTKTAHSLKLAHTCPDQPIIWKRRGSSIEWVRNLNLWRQSQK